MCLRPGWEETLGLSRLKKRWVKQKGQAKEPCQEVRVLPDRGHWERGRWEALGWSLLRGMVPTQGRARRREGAVSPPKGELRCIRG